MHRILILDTDSADRSALVESIAQNGDAEAVVAADEEELAAMVRFGRWAAVFADGALLGAGASALMDALRTTVFRPMLIIAGDEKSEGLDPELVALVVRKPCDVQMLTGILLSGITPATGGQAGDIVENVPPPGEG